MSSARFDELTKALARATSRRQALKTIAGTALGGVLGLGGIGTALAKCKPAGIGCNSNSQCCDGSCCHGTCCGPGQVCLCNGTCATPLVDGGGNCPCGSFIKDISSGTFYCNSFSPGPSCTTDCDCPKGQFCTYDGGCLSAC